MSDEMLDKKITQGQAERIAAPMELDLWAAFKIMEEDMVKLADGYIGTPEEFIQEVTNLLLPGERGNRVEKEQVKKNLLGDAVKLGIFVLRKGRALPAGTRRKRSDGTYIKQSDGTWKKVVENKKQETEKKIPPEVIGKEGYSSFVRQEYSYMNKVLTENEKESMAKYTDFGFTNVNNDIRKGKENFYATDIKAAFKKLKPLSKDVRMFRGMIVSEEVLEKIKNSEFISDKAFTSITTDPATAIKFTGSKKDDKSQKKIILRIDISKGSKVLNMNNPGEQEFLLPADSKFKIGNIKTSGDLFIMDVKYEF